MSSAKGREFDTKAAIRAWDSELGSGDSLLFIEGARWQHQQDMKALDAALAEVERLKVDVLSWKANFETSEQIWQALKGDLTTAQAEIAELKLALADRSEKYKIAMDKGVDVLGYKLKTANALLSECLSTFQRRQHSDDACGHPFDEDFGEIINKIIASRRGAG